MLSRSYAAVLEAFALAWRPGRGVSGDELLENRLGLHHDEGDAAPEVEAARHAAEHGVPVPVAADVEKEYLCSE